MLNAYVGSCMAAVDPVYWSFMAAADLIVPVCVCVCVCVCEGSGEIVCVGSCI